MALKLSKSTKRTINSGVRAAKKQGAAIAKSAGEVGGEIIDAVETAVSEIGDYDWSGTLDKLGLSDENVKRMRKAIDDVDVSESIDRASEYLAKQVKGAQKYTKKNPTTVAAGAAGVLVGASLLAYALNRARKEPTALEKVQTTLKKTSKSVGKTVKKASKAANKQVAAAKKQVAAVKKKLK